MIWSTSATKLRQHAELLRTSRGPGPRLRTADKLQTDFDKRNTPFDAPEYFEMPPISHTVGKIVVPFVALDARGKLIASLPAFYGVSKRPDTHGFDSIGITERMQQSHVVAEDISLRNGIFTPFARTTAELFVIDTLAETVQEGYIRDRMAHLDVLRSEAEGSEQLYEKQRQTVVEELSVAFDALHSRIA